MTFGDNGKWVKIAFDEDASKIYIAGLYSPAEEGYEDLGNNAVVGRLMDGGAIFNSRQYVGIDPYYYYAFVSGGTVSGGGAYLDIEDTYFMTSDASRNRLTSASTLVVSEGENQGYVLEFFPYPAFDAQAGYVDPSPAEPVIKGFMPYTQEFGYGGIKVQIPNVNKNGQLLHDENISYAVIVNDRQILFDPAKYPEFSVPTPWIPFYFSSYNIEIDPYEVNTRMVFLTDELEDVQTLSVQSRYRYQDSYYVTNGKTYLYKLPNPEFYPAPGYDFPGEGEVTITGFDNAILAYRVITDLDVNPEFIDSETNVVKIKVDRNCVIQARCKASSDDDTTWSDIVTASYTVDSSSVKSISAELDEETAIYTVDGMRVEKESMRPGFYIVVKSGEAKRVLIK